jgi:hypothetical protein
MELHNSAAAPSHTLLSSLTHVENTIPHQEILVEPRELLDETLFLTPFSVSRTHM